METTLDYLSFICCCGLVDGNPALDPDQEFSSSLTNEQEVRRGRSDTFRMNINACTMCGSGSEVAPEMDEIWCVTGNHGSS
mmetsp:Transcript_16092/g.17748  ORF Transcript_16092/g.17748 Transcript_16092/m.17748 type:complete len:81 (+) Transcript_16092:112-354(+)